MANAEERLRILKMIELGQVTAEDGERLLNAMDDGQAAEAGRERLRARMLRVRITDLHRQRGKVEVRIPTSLIDVGLRLGARLAPRVSVEQLNDILRAVERGATGRVFELQDLDEGERVEIFVE